MTQDLGLIDDADRLAKALPPLRRALLDALDEPDSAAGLARRLGLPRQKVNYHLRELERAGFVEVAEERRVRGCTERRMRVTSRALVVSPNVVTRAAGALVDGDAQSSAYLIASAARTIDAVAALRARAADSGKRLATFTAETEIAFASPAALSDFCRELGDAVTALAAKYNDQPGRRRRGYRLAVGLHPRVAGEERQ